MLNSFSMLTFLMLNSMLPFSTLSSCRSYRFDDIIFEVDLPVFDINTLYQIIRDACKQPNFCQKSINIQHFNKNYSQFSIFRSYTGRVFETPVLDITILKQQQRRVPLTSNLNCFHFSPTGLTAMQEQVPTSLGLGSKMEKLKKFRRRKNAIRSPVSSRRVVPRNQATSTKV